MDYVKLQDQSEEEVTREFIKYYNKINNVMFTRVIKNNIQNEIDVFCYTDDDNFNLKIQVKKADPRVVGNLGRSRKINIKDRPLITRDGDQAIKSIFNNIQNVENKYKLQHKDMSDIFLLLEDLMDPTSFVFEQIKNKIQSSSFKEIWIVTRNNCYKLY
jgi:hypothetical protein